MPRLHFEPGAAATDYRFRVELTFTHTSDGVNAVRSEGIALTRFGNPYPISGIRQVVRATYNPITLTSDKVVYLDSPILGIAESQVSTAGTPTSRVEIDGAEMTATLCLAWTLTFDELRWYVDGVEVLDRFGRSILDSTLGPYSVSGDDYRQGENQTRILAQCGFDPEFFHGQVACGGSAAYSVRNYADATVLGGWGHDTGGGWAAEPITIDALTLPSPTWPGLCSGSCTCTTALPSVSETDAYNVTVTALEDYTFTAVFFRSTTCTCPTGSIIGSVPADVYQYNKDYISKDSLVDAISQNDTALLTSQRTTKAACTCNYPHLNDDYTETDTTTTDAIAYAMQQRNVQRTVSEKFCGFGLVACTSPEGSILPPSCPTLNESLCYYAGQVQQVPRETCACTASEPSLTHTDDGQWVMAYACDTDIYTAYADQYRQPGNGLSFVARDTGKNGSDPAIGVYTYGGSEEWVLVYVDGGTVYYSISQDWGGTWGVSTPVGTGTRPRVHITADNRRIITRLDGTDIEAKMYDGAMTLVEDAGVIQAGVDASSHHDISSYSGGQGEWVALLAYVAGGSVVAKTSNDGKAYT